MAIQVGKGNSVKIVQPLGFGCCPMGGHGWGPVDSEKLIEAVKVALDLGIQLFDTSDIYGLGYSETLLGKALNGRRREAVISTKFGVRYESGISYHDNSAIWIRSAVEASLRRLSTDYIDLYQMHYWDEKTPLNEVFDTLGSLVKEGKIKSFGISNFDPNCEELIPYRSNIATYSYQYSLVDRKYESLIASTQQMNDYTFLAWGSLGQGILSGKYSNPSSLDERDRRHRSVYENFHGAKLAAIQEMLTNMRSWADQDGHSLVQMSLRWVLERFPRCIPLVGIKEPAQIKDAAGILNFKMTKETREALEQLSSKVLSTTTSL